MVQETQNFNNNFNILSPTSEILATNNMKQNQKSPTNHTVQSASPMLSSNSLLMQANTHSKANESDKSLKSQNLSKRQFSLDYDSEKMNVSRKNYSLNDFFPTFHPSNSKIVGESQIKSPVGPIQRPLSSSTSNPTNANQTNNANLLENFTTWLSSNFKNSNNLTANLNMPSSVITNNDKFHTVKDFSSNEVLNDSNVNTSLDPIGNNADNPFNEFKLFGTESNSSSINASAPKLNFNEASIWNTNSEENQAWNSVLINDINSLAPTQSFLNSSSSGNQIKNLWSNSFEFVEQPSHSIKNSQKQQKAKKLETKLNKK